MFRDGGWHAAAGWYLEYAASTLPGRLSTSRPGEVVQLQTGEVVQTGSRGAVSLSVRYRVIYVVIASLAVWWSRVGVGHVARG